MNAKTVQKRQQYPDEQQSDIGFTATNPERHQGQDLFVDDDPALTGREPGESKEPTKNASVGSDLRIEKLTYVHQMLCELRKLCQSLDEPMVAYLIEMALLETDTALNVGQFRDQVSVRTDSGF